LESRISEKEKKEEKESFLANFEKDFSFWTCPFSKIG
jgi:hypothetical protein